MPGLKDQKRVHKTQYLKWIWKGHEEMVGENRVSKQVAGQGRAGSVAGVCGSWPLRLRPYGQEL